MKAVRFDTFGGPEVLHVVDVPLPDPGPGQVRISVRASGVNPADSKIRAGDMQAIFPTALALLAVHAGDTVLIHGASGSVGTIAVQMAVARGATVIGTASEDNQDYVRSLGAIPVVHGEGLVDRVRDLSRPVDAVLDAAGR